MFCITLFFSLSFGLIEKGKRNEGFPGSSDGKESSCNLGECVRSLSGKDRSFGERNGNPLQYSCLENSMDRGAWKSIVHGVTKSWTRLRGFNSLHICSPGTTEIPIA